MTKRRPSWKNVSLYSPFNPFPVAPKKASEPPGERTDTSNGKFSPPVCSKILSTGFPPFASKTALRNGSLRRSHSACGIPAGIPPNASFGIERRSTKASAIPLVIRSRARSGLEPTRRTRAPRDFAIWAPGKLVPFPPPITRTVSPGRTESLSATVRYAVPYVRSMAASLSGVWFRRAPVTGTARSSSTTANWALNPSCVSYPRMFRPVHESRMTTWPTLTVETPGPASTTIPRASLPGTCTDAASPFPNTGTGSPSAAKFVLKLGPVARIATRTRFASFGFRRGAGRYSMRTDRDGGPYRSRWIVSASIRCGRGVPSDGANPRGQESSRGVGGTGMSESSGFMVRSGIRVRLVRCAFSRRVFVDQTLFCAFRERGTRCGFFRGPFRVLTPVAFRVYDEGRNGETCAVVTRKIDPRESLHQRIRHPAQRKRASGRFRLRSGENPRPAERRGRRNARRSTDGPTGSAEES